MQGYSEFKLDPMDEIGPLTDAVVAGLATEEQRARLDQLVSESDEARWSYVRYVHDSVAIHRRVQEMRLVAELQSRQDTGSSASSVDDGLGNNPGTDNSLGLLSNLVDEGLPYVLHHHLSSPRLFRQRRSFQKLLRAGTWATLCSLLILVGGGVGWWVSTSGGLTRPTAAIEPVRFAKIIRTTGCAWKKNGKEVSLETGDWLLTGRYTLSEGLAQIVFPWGTEATLESPMEIEFTPSGTRQLWHGQLIAKVSPEDTGFTIDTPTVKLIDLGTEFGLSTDLNGESEVHVFKGAVEVRPRYVDHGAQNSPITLLTGEANGFAADQGGVRQIAFNPKRFSRAWRLNNRVAETTGAMRFVHPAPQSVAEGRTESNESLVLFLEREDQSLPQPLPITITDPGLYTTFNNRVSWLPPDVHVDSYLIHFDPVGSSNIQAPIVAEGSVTFDRPILGIIARGDQLAGSDEWFACRETQYKSNPIFRKRAGVEFTSNILPGYTIRGLSGLWNMSYSHESPAPNDLVRLSADRKTLTVKCCAGGEADQLRVLVATDGQEHPAVVSLNGTPSPRPFHGKPFVVGQTIEAEDFDLGGQDVGYYDTTPDSLSNVYRGNESVELRSYVIGDNTTTNVSIARAGEWLCYTVDIDRPGLYIIKAQAGSQLVGGKFRFEIGELGAALPVTTNSLNVPVTSLEVGSKSNWYSTVQSIPVELKAGRQVLRVIMETNHTSGRLGNFDWFSIEPVSRENPQLTKRSP